MSPQIAPEITALEHSDPALLSPLASAASPVANGRRPPVSLADIHLREGLPLVRGSGNQHFAYRLGKRILDLVGGLALLILLAPIMLTITIILMVTTRGRPFFVQERVGYLGKRFRMFKFRTMRLDAESVQHLVKNEQQGPVFKNRLDPRITRIGGFLRKTSLDETPQLINVLLGDMSLVGPRPPVAREVAEYAPWQRKRLSVKPGLTCLWQVSGRCEVDFEDWVRMDIWYARNQNLKTDLNLLLRTPGSVLSGRGAY